MQWVTMGIKGMGLAHECGVSGLGGGGLMRKWV